MKLHRECLAVFVIFLLVVPEAIAGEWQIVGPRALGMGGANIAVANDATASYWNFAIAPDLRDEVQCDQQLWPGLFCYAQRSLHTRDC